MVSRRSAWILFIGCCLVLSSLVAGRPVDRGEASRIASAFLATRSMGELGPRALTEGSREVRPLIHPETGKTVAYVCDLEPRGFVVVSPDTAISPVIAYALDAIFPWSEGTDNPLVWMILSDLSLRLEALERGLILIEDASRSMHQWETMSSGSSSSAPQASTMMVGPLLESPTWGQSAPWDEACPVDPMTGERSDPGCVAIALAQILSYWQYPDAVEFGSGAAYTTATRRIDVSASEASLRSIDYAIAQHRNPSDETMANLVFAAGVSVKMDYTSDGSGAIIVDAARALAGSKIPLTYSRDVSPNVWGFESAAVKTCTQSGWGADYYVDTASFYDHLRDDMAEGEPAILCIAVPGEPRSHAVLCDGFEPKTGRYHLNFGWGGYTDGWYALPEGMPAGYSIVEYGVLDIRPPSALHADADHDPSPASPLPETQINPSPFGRFYAATMSSGRDVVFSYTSNESASTLLVQVFDLTGRLVWAEETHDEREIHWDGQSLGGETLAHGPYIYVVRALSDSASDLERGTVFLMP